MQAVNRIFSMLNTIAARPEGVTLSEISTSVGLAKSTTSRFLQSLEDVGAVSKKDNKFSIGIGIASLASAVPATTFIQALAYPTLLELADQSRETVHLGIREGEKLSYIEQINTPHRVQLETWLNKSYPLHVTAAGKIFLAYADDDVLSSYLAKPLEAYSSKTITNPKLLKKELELVRQKGYAQTNQEFSEDISGFAVGIFDAAQQVIASIGVSGPSFRFPEDDKAIVHLLLKASKQLSKKLRKEDKVVSD